MKKISLQLVVFWLSCTSTTIAFSWTSLPLSGSQPHRGTRRTWHLQHLLTKSHTDDYDEKPPSLSARKQQTRKRRNKRSWRGQHLEQRQQPPTTAVQRLAWLNQATDHLVSTPPGSLVAGKWHEVVSILTAWSDQITVDRETPLRMEALLKRLVEERRAGNTELLLTVQLYNQVLAAWAQSSSSSSSSDNDDMNHQLHASQRAREILVSLQETYETTREEALKPDADSFGIVLELVCRAEGALIARRLLAWMEYLDKSRKNTAAKPTRDNYIMLLEAYAASAAHGSNNNAGVLAEAFLRHMKLSAGIQPDAACYNIAIQAYTYKGGREAAEHAQRILDEMDATPDLVTYSRVIAAWAASGMKAHAVSRAEAILRTMEEQQQQQANTVVLNAVMSTWVKSRNPAAVERTLEILRQMELSGTAAPPDLVSYNTHLHALSIHANKKPVYASQADALLQQMEQGQLSSGGDNVIAPNPFSYNVVIEAYCRAQLPNSAQLAANALRRLVKREGVEPDTFAFNQVLSALSKSSATIPSAARKAQDLLLYMEDAYKAGVHPHAKPDAMSYSCVTVAYARSSEPGAAERAEAFLQRMSEQYAKGESDVKPSRVCYNALIDAWAKSGQGTLGARKAEALLHYMQERFLVEGDEDMAPDLITFNSVLNAWARSGTRCCGRKAETYLNRMWELYQAGDKRVKPNEFSYNTVINAISKSQDERKAQKALRVLRRMDKEYQAGNKEARPNEISYTAVLNSCAFPARLDPATRRKALDTAIFTLKELQSSRYGHPNQVTYSTFIKACANLLPDDDEMRRVVIKRTFRQCCKDGQVGPRFIEQIRRAAPKDLFEELLAVSADSTISIHDLPLEWRCNVREQKRPHGVESSSSSTQRRQRPKRGDERQRRLQHP